MGGELLTDMKAKTKKSPSKVIAWGVCRMNQKMASLLSLNGANFRDGTEFVKGKKKPNP